MIKKYRKKPVVIEAMRLTSISKAVKIHKWINSFNSPNFNAEYGELGEVGPNLTINYSWKPSNGLIKGWWAVLEWPCHLCIMSNEEFQATYEEVVDEVI